MNASPCPVDATCGGCQNIAVPYDEQLVAKNLAVRDVLQREGLLSAGVSLRPILGMDEPFNYRNKVASPFARGRKLPKPSAKDKGRRNRLDCEVLTGMYVAGTHNLVNTNGCLIENEQANSVIAVIKSLMVRYGVQPYHEDSGTGFLRHAVVRVGHTTGEVLVTLVTNARDFPGSKQFCRELVKKCPFVTTVVQNVNTRQTNVILGTEEHVLYGPGFILDTLCGLSFRISSQSFYQVNATQTEVLYRVAVGFANLTGAETVIDAYCGTGTIGLVAAKSGAAQVIGVESVPSAVKDARTNAAHNGVENARFVVDDAESALRAWAAEGDMDPATTVLMMDPPRAGATEGFLQAACRLSPARIVYISCNPETQARDMAFLVRHGYTLRTVQPVDMFPHTPHVECVVLMTRIEPK
ncbi:MAG: 23S rRNA (uracil(1939)-C(5))-methyltransferase RlmD [Coriobacteriia bacterium]|nr:23S rRNA (uracil(1939)-C(5))-methyltransferase RlmD [Coriobacteriia bacterium]